MLKPSEVMVVEWTMFALAYIMVALTAFVRISSKQTHLWLSEALLLLAALSLLGVVICDTLTYKLGAMSEFGMFNESLGKIRFATCYFFDAGLYLPKLSLLAIYFRLIPYHLVYLRRALYSVTAFVASGVLFTTFADTFWCGKHPSVNWSTDPGACSTFTAPLLNKINWCICITSEALIFLLPIPLVPQAKSIDRRRGAGLVVLFTLGIITMAVSTGRYISMTHVFNDITIYAWATTEFAVSIMVVSCMALRPLVAKLHRVITGLATGSSKRSNQHSGTKSFLGSRPGSFRPSDSQTELNDLNPRPCGNQIIKTSHIHLSSARRSIEEESQRPSMNWERDTYVYAI